MVGHAMPTTFVGLFSLRIRLFVFEGSRSVLMAKRVLSLQPTMSQMDLIPLDS